MSGYAYSANVGWIGLGGVTIEGHEGADTDGGSTTLSKGSLPTAMYFHIEASVPLAP